MADFRRTSSSFPPSPSSAQSGQPGDSTPRPAGRRGRSAKTVLVTEQAVYDCAVALLARSAKTVAQLRQRLRQRTAPGTPGEALIDAAIARLKEHGYLSDARFAQTYAGTRLTQAHLGRRRIAQELLHKGVPSELVEREVAAAFATTDELTQARAFLAKKRVRPPTDERDAARIFRLLARAGFTSGTATQALRHLRAQHAQDPTATDAGGRPADLELGDMSDCD